MAPSTSSSRWCWVAERAQRGLWALTLAGLSACFDYHDPGPEDPRLLDRACGVAEGCPVTGSAKGTSGLTADSLGFVLGPGAGSVRVPFELQSGSGSVTLDVLLAGTGRLRVTSSSLGISREFELSDDYAWHSAEGHSSGTSEPPIEVILSVEADSRAEVADLRATGIDHVGSCSVGAPGRMPR